jgi:hypothetical protein
MIVMGWNMKRRSRREAVAMLFAADIATIDVYQPGRTTIPVYVGGSDYYVALRDGERPPQHFGEWVKVGDSCGYRIFMATPA